MAIACGIDTGGPRPRFDIWEYKVTGNTTLQVAVIEKAVYAFLGPDRTIDDVDHACAALEKAYRDAGGATVNVDIPEQPVTQGVIELRVVEGQVEQVKVSGARYHDQERILAALPAAATREVLNFNALRGQLANVNQSADRRVQPLLRPGHAPGTAEVEFKVDDSLPLHGSVDLSNRYSPSRAPNPGDYRLAGTVRYDNLWQREHSLSLSYLTSPGHPDEVQVTSASYTLPMGQPERSLTLYAVHSNSNSDLTTSMAGTNVLGRGDILGLRYSQPIGHAQGMTQSLTLGADFKDSREDLNQLGTGSFPTPLTYWLGSAQYAAVLPDPRGQTDFGVGLSLSARGLRNNDDQFALKRYKGQANFAVLHWNLQRNQNLARKFTLVARLEGQLASAPLPSNEEYVAGGVDSVRGYPEGVQAGDVGVRESIELRTPSLIRGADPSANLRLLTFVEGARLKVLDPLPGQIDNYTLASLGLGLRLSTRRGLSSSMDYAWRLRDGQTTDTHGSVGKGGGRLHFDVSCQF